MPHSTLIKSPGTICKFTVFLLYGRFNEASTFARQSCLAIDPARDVVVVVAPCQAAAVLGIPRAPVLVRVLEHIEVASLGCLRARVRIPRASVLVGVPEDVQMASLRRAVARLGIPRARVLVRVPEYVEVAAPGCQLAGVPVPRASLLVEVLEHVQVAEIRRDGARLGAPPRHIPELAVDRAPQRREIPRAHALVD